MSHESCRDAHAELEHQLRLAEETADSYALENRRLRQAMELAAHRAHGCWLFTDRISDEKHRLEALWRDLQAALSVESARPAPKEEP